MQKKLDKELSEMDQYEKITKRETKGETYFKESFYYGRQLNKFPTKKDNAKLKE